MAIRLDLQQESAASSTPTPQVFETWVRAALQQSYTDLEQTIRLVDEAESRALNLQFRGIDKPTNVLAFPGDSERLDYDCLGDLVICAPVVEREADEQGKKSDAHWAHMVVHGMLHLQGFDHQDDDQTEAMEALEIKILDTLGYTNPYNG